MADGAGAEGGHHVPASAFSGRAPLDLAALVALEEPARDGRVARGQRTRRSVAEALMELLRAGETDPTAKAVALRAGVSLRLVFHHFADMDDLYQFRGRAAGPSPVVRDAPTVPPAVAADPHRTNGRAPGRPVRRDLGDPARPRMPGPDIPRSPGGGGHRKQPLPSRPQSHLCRRIGRPAGARPCRLPERHGHWDVLGGLGALADDVGPLGTRGEKGHVPHAREALCGHRKKRRHRHVAGIAVQPASPSSQSSGCSVIRRRTSATLGAG